MVLLGSSSASGLMCSRDAAIAASIASCPAPVKRPVGRPKVLAPLGVQAQGTPKIAKIRFRIIRVCRINSVLYRMGRLKSPYDPSLVLEHNNIRSTVLRLFVLRVIK